MLVPAIYGFVAVAFGVTGMVFSADPQNMMVARVFYVGISVMNLFLVSVFWSFLLEFLQSEQTKRLFGFIAAGGTTGALVGPFITERFVNHVGNLGHPVLRRGHVRRRHFLPARCWWPRCATSMRGPLRAPRSQAVARDRGVGGNPFAGVSSVLQVAVPARHRAVRHHDLHGEHHPVLRTAARW